MNTFSPHIYETESVKEKIVRLFEEIQNSLCKQERIKKEEEMESLQNGSRQ